MIGGQFVGVVAMTVDPDASGHWLDEPDWETAFACIQPEDPFNCPCSNQRFAKKRKMITKRTRIIIAEIGLFCVYISLIKYNPRHILTKRYAINTKDKCLVPQLNPSAIYTA